MYRHDHSRTPAIAAAERRNVRDTARLTVAAYSRAYGGAAAAFHDYADSFSDEPMTVVAVRASSPGLTVGPVEDPADRHLDPSKFYYTQCQRTGSQLTVLVFGQFHGDAGKRDAVALTNGAYRAVARG